MEGISSMGVALDYKLLLGGDASILKGLWSGVAGVSLDEFRDIWSMVAGCDLASCCW